MLVSHRVLLERILAAGVFRSAFALFRVAFSPAVCCSSAQHTLSATRPTRASLEWTLWLPNLVPRACCALPGDVRSEPYDAGRVSRPVLPRVFRSLLLVFLSLVSRTVLSPGLAVSTIHRRILWTKSVSAQWSKGGTKPTTNLFFLCLA